MKGPSGAGQRSWSGMWSPHQALFSGTCTVLRSEFLMRPRVAEGDGSCLHGRNPSDALFFPTDILAVTPAVTSLRGSSNAFGGEICISLQLGSSPILTSMSFPRQ